MKAIVFAIIFSFLSGNVFGEVISQNPDEEWLEQYKKEDLSDLESSAKSGDGKALYILGISYLDGNYAAEKNDYEKAHLYLKKAWLADIADAGYILATMYYKGEGVKKDLDKARCYILASAEQGLLISQALLARAYWGQQYSDLFEKNIDKAIFWLKRASSSGDASSAFGLAYLYENGEGVDKNENQAFIWRKKSVELSYNRSQGYFLPLAKYYEEGIGTQKDLVQAYEYYDLSGTAGVEGKQRIAKEMTQEQIDKAIQKSREWQEKHNTYVPSYSGMEHQVDGNYR